MTPIKLFSSLAVMGALPTLMQRFQTDRDIQVNASFAPTKALIDRLRAREAADLAILTAQGIDDMIAEGIIRPGSKVDVALSFVGIGVKAGAPKPDVSTVEALKASLLAARCVAYSRIGASGVYFADLLQRLGIADAVNAKALIIPTGLTADRLLTDEADLAVQQVSELMLVPGIDIADHFPKEVQSVAMFSGGLVTDRPEAADLLRFVASPKASPALWAGGLEPPPRTA